MQEAHELLWRAKAQVRKLSRADVLTKAGSDKKHLAPCI